MRNIWKWILGIAGGLIVLGIIASAFFVRFFFRAPMMAAQRGFVPRDIPNPGPGMQRMPHMFGGMGGYGHFGPFGNMGFGRGGLLMFLPHLLWQLLLLALVVAGVIFLVRALSRPRAGAPSGVQAVTAAPAAPVAAVVVPSAPVASAVARTCASCGRELQADWTHCPHCGTPVQA